MNGMIILSRIGLRLLFSLLPFIALPTKGVGAESPTLVAANKQINSLDVGMGFNIAQLRFDDYWPEYVVGRALTEAEWDMYFDNISWAGCQYARVGCISIGMFSSSPGKYSWDSDKMRRLYRILQELKERNITCYINNWNWNFLEDASYPKTNEEFIEANAQLMHQLVVVRKFSNVTGWGCTNESEIKHDLQDILVPLVRARLDKLGLSKIQIVGSDDTGYLSFGHIDPKIIDIASAHDYVSRFSGSPVAWLDYVKGACGTRVPTILGEIGHYGGPGPGGSGGSDEQNYEGSRSVFHNTLLNLRNGYKGFLHWEHNICAIKSWNCFSPLTKDDPAYYWKPYAPTYYNQALIMRYVRKGWKVYDSKVDVTGAQLINVVMRSPDGADSTILLHNQGPSPQTFRIDLSALPACPKTLNHISVTGFTDSSMNEGKAVTLNQGISGDITMPGRSTLTLTTLPAGDLRAPLTHCSLPIPANIVNDSVLGSGLRQFEFSGTWPYDNGAPRSHGRDHHFNVGVPGDYYQVKFHGTGVKIYAVTDAQEGIAAVSIDGGKEADVDFFTPDRRFQQLLYTSPPLAEGDHIVKVRVKGEKNAKSSGLTIVADKVEIIE
jgi:hypothetical protein